jgi:hypothetical protein
MSSCARSITAVRWTRSKAELKELNAALEELIELAEAGRTLHVQLGRIKALRKGLLKWFISPYGMNLGALPLVGTSVVLGAGVMQLINAISPSDGAELGAAVLGAHAGTAAIRVALADRQKPWSTAARA